MSWRIRLGRGSERERDRELAAFVQKLHEQRVRTSEKRKDFKEVKDLKELIGSAVQQKAPGNLAYGSQGIICVVVSQIGMQSYLHLGKPTPLARKVWHHLSRLGLSY